MQNSQNFKSEKKQTEENVSQSQQLTKSMEKKPTVQVTKQPEQKKELSINIIQNSNIRVESVDSKKSLVQKPDQKAEILNKKGAKETKPPQNDKSKDSNKSNKSKEKDPKES